MSFLKALWTSNNLLLRLLRICALLVVALVILIVTFEDKLIYFPEKYPAGFWSVARTSGRETAGVAEGSILPRIEDCDFEASDGTRLHGWYCSPFRKAGNSFLPVDSKMVLLWLHGNAGNLSHRYDMIRALIGLPIEIFIIDYRGYGKSSGTPGEAGLYIDAQAAWNFLVNEKGIAPSRVIIFGKSLGGVPAVDLATKVNAAGLIVQSSFSSARDMAHEILPLLPTMLLHTKMDSISKIGRITCPKLFIHSRADEVVPFKLGHKLYEAAAEPKEFYEVANAPHNSTYLAGGRAYLDALRRFADRCSKTD